MGIVEKSSDMKHISIGSQLKLKKMGLFRLYREIDIGDKQTKEAEAINAALEKNFIDFHNITDFSLALNNLDEREIIINKAKQLFYQIQERAKRIYQEITKERRQEDIMIESRLNGGLDDVVVMRILLKIVFEGKDSHSFLDRIISLFDWLELKRPAAIFLAEEKVISGRKWQVITIENSQCRYCDDMSEDIRRRHRKFKEIFESAGCNVFYNTSSSSGTRITIEVPPEIVEGKFILTDKIFKKLDNHFLGI